MKQAKSYGMMAGMILAWSVYYTVSKLMVDATGSAYAAGFLLRSFALVFLTIQLLADGSFRRLLRQGRAAALLVLIVSLSSDTSQTRPRTHFTSKSFCVLRYKSS